METQWRDQVILDYEVDFPACSSLELGLYSLGAARFTTVLLGQHREFGSHKRPGILEVPASFYQEAFAEFSDRCFDLEFVTGLADRFKAVLSRLEDLNRTLEQNACRTVDDPRAVGVEIVDALADLMAFHVLNWAIPFDALEDYLEQTFGDRVQGRECLMTLLVPVTAAHLTDFAEFTAQAFSDMEDSAWNAHKSARLAEAIDYLQAPGLARGKLSDGTAMEEFVRSLSADDVRHLDAMRASRLRAEQVLGKRLFDLYVAAGANLEALARSEAVVTVCQLAAEEEEQRRRWQSRSLRNVRKLADHCGLDLTDLLPDGWGARAAAAPTPLLPADSPHWRWLESD